MSEPEEGEEREGQVVRTCTSYQQNRAVVVLGKAVVLHSTVNTIKTRIPDGQQAITTL